MGGSYSMPSNRTAIIIQSKGRGGKSKTFMRK